MSDAASHAHLAHKGSVESATSIGKNTSMSFKARQTIIAMIERRGRLHEKGQCIHHWVIDENDVGTCKKCGEVRDFRALLATEGHKKIPFGGITELPPEVNDRIIIRKELELSVFWQEKR